MKPCLIKQPAGIGDIFFCQKIARYMMHHGYQVIWPVLPSIHWIKDYIKDIYFPTVDDEFPMKEIYDQGAGYVIEDGGAFISTATADMTHNDGKIMNRDLGKGDYAFVPAGGYHKAVSLTKKRLSCSFPILVNGTAFDEREWLSI